MNVWSAVFTSLTLCIHQFPLVGYVEDDPPVQTEDPDNQTNDIANGKVDTGRNARAVGFVCTCLYRGVTRLTNPRISQQDNPTP